MGITINDSKASAAALRRVQELADDLGISGARAACLLIVRAPQFSDWHQSKLNLPGFSDPTIVQALENRARLDGAADPTPVRRSHHKKVKEP